MVKMGEIAAVGKISAEILEEIRNKQRVTWI